MRQNLIDLLDAISLPRLGIERSSQLFGDRADPVHYTSALRYPVTLRGGTTPAAPASIDPNSRATSCAGSRRKLNRGETNFASKT
jgi:hypothetical protein